MPHYFITIMLLLVLACQNDECISGQITVSSLSKKQAAGKTDLPADFSYSSKELLQAIGSFWVDGSGDTIVEIGNGDSVSISYTIAGAHSKCGTTSTFTRFIGTARKGGLGIDGLMRCYNSADYGEIHVAVSEIPFSGLFKKERASGSTYLLFASGIPALGISGTDTLRVKP